jgi:hypothetical protein
MGMPVSPFFPRGKFGFIISPGDICQRFVERGFCNVREVVQNLDVEFAPDQFVEPDAGRRFKVEG